MLARIQNGQTRPWVTANTANYPLFRIESLSAERFALRRKRGFVVLARVNIIGLSHIV